MQKKNRNAIIIVIITILLAFMGLGIGTVLVGGIIVANTDIEDIFGSNKKEEMPSETIEKEDEAVVITIEWDGKYAESGELIDLDVALNGTLEDGSTVTLDESSRKAHASDGRLVATFAKEISEKKGTVTIKLYNTEGVFSLEGNDGNFDPEKWNNEISSVNATATISGVEKEDVVLESETGLYRSYTGFWFWGIGGIDNGEWTEYDSSWITEGYDDMEEVTEDNSSETDLPDISLSDEELEERIEDIREIYYGVENNISAYEVQDGGSGTVRYLKDGEIRKITAQPSAYTDLGYQSRYTAQYYYEDNKVAFVFVFYGTEEYRFYMDSEDCQKVIRYIDAAGNVHDYPKGISANSISLVGYYCGFAMQELHWAGVY